MKSDKIVGVIDCGINNIKSLLNALDYIQKPYAIIDNYKSFENHDDYILPGVGSFDAGVKALKNKDLFSCIVDADYTKKKIFGICLGMQLLCKNSEEGELDGLGIIDADVVNLRKLGCMGKIPHVGFNEISDIVSNQDTGFLSSMVGNDYYFIHSFGLNLNNKMNIDYAKTEYENSSIVAAIKLDNVFATQFHPEKSGLKGVSIFNNYL